jgi:regulator of protease activity HflC (stomatin/prohibitin superfamily)
VERLGGYSRTRDPGRRHVLVPFLDRVRAVVPLTEQVVSFPPRPVITSDDLMITVDTVMTFRVTDPRAAVYEISDYLQGLEQLTVTTLRTVIGSLNLNETLAGQAQITTQVRDALDDVAGRWGIRVTRVDLTVSSSPTGVPS